MKTSLTHSGYRLVENALHKDYFDKSPLHYQNRKIYS